MTLPVKDICFLMLILMDIGASLHSGAGDEEWRGPFAQLEMKVDRALRRLAILKVLDDTPTRETLLPPTTEEHGKIKQTSAFSTHLDTMEHQLVSQLDALVSRLEKIAKAVHQVDATQSSVETQTVTKDFPQHDHQLVPSPESKKTDFTEQNNPVMTSSMADNADSPTILNPNRGSEDAVNKLDANLRAMNHRILRKLNRLQQAMPTGEKDLCANLLIPHLDKVQEEVTKGQRALEQDVGVVRQLLNLELGVSLRAMQVDLQHCHRSTAELRDLMAETLKRQRQVEPLSGRQMGYFKDAADMSSKEMADMFIYKGRNGATVVREMQMDDHLGEGIATELMLSHPRSCAELFLKGYKRSGIYTIWPTFNSTVQLQKYAYCDMETEGGGWTVFQRRGDFGGKQENFTRPWKDYKRGFGKVNRDFWLGNDALHVLTTQEPVCLRIELEDWEGDRRVAQYDLFSVANEANLYRLSVGNFTGNVPDSFLYHDGSFFSTIDHNNAGHQSRQCVLTQGQGGGWWYDNCYRAKLNSPYKMQGAVGRAEGLQWRMWKGYEYSLKSSEMKIRPACFPETCFH